MNRVRQLPARYKALSDLKLPDDLRKLNIPQCTALCDELRQLLIETVLKTGGHLASNLGVVELTLAIHRNFHSPYDKIVWDVGHQAYVHKILTGRGDSFRGLRQEGGLSGFPKPEESPHDCFITGHSSTAVSAAFGMAEAFRMRGDTSHYAVAVVGDGATTGGMFYEGLNNAGKSRSNLIVILNDNSQAISKNTGAIAKYLSKIRSSTSYVQTKWKLEKTLSKTPLIGDKLVTSLKDTKDRLRKNIVQTTLFEDMGFVYLGPVDGHDVESLDEALTVAKSYRRPVLVHVHTIKGKGYGPAEENPGEYHGVPKEANKTQELAKIYLDEQNPEVSVDECFSTAMGLELTALADRDDKLCAVTAAMKYGTGLQFFGEQHRERFFDVGIAEQHAVTFCASLASMGMLPVFAVYSTFLQRAYDQIIHDTAIAGYHMVLAVDRAGLVGEDGETHQGIFDVPMLTTIPGIKVYSPADYQEVRLCLRQALYHDNGLVAVRYPRGKEPQCSMIEPGICCQYADGKDILLITYGRIAASVFDVRKKLADEGISCAVVRMTQIYPIPQEVIKIAARFEKVLFVEEGSEEGGLAEKVALQLMLSDFHGTYRINAIRGFVRHASVQRCLKNAGLSSDEIEEQIRRMVNGSNET